MISWSINFYDIKGLDYDIIVNIIPMIYYDIIVYHRYDINYKIIIKTKTMIL